MTSPPTLAGPALPRERSCFYGGRWHAPLSNAWTETRSPATGELLARVADAGSDDVAAAVDAARTALPAWSRMHHRERAVLLRRCADTLRSHADELALLDALTVAIPCRKCVATR